MSSFCVTCRNIHSDRDSLKAVAPFTWQDLIEKQGDAELLPSALDVEVLLDHLMSEDGI